MKKLILIFILGFVQIAYSGEQPTMCADDVTHTIDDIISHSSQGFLRTYDKMQHGDTIRHNKALLACTVDDGYTSPRANLPAESAGVIALRAAARNHKEKNQQHERTFKKYMIGGAVVNVAICVAWLTSSMVILGQCKS